MHNARFPCKILVRYFSKKISVTPSDQTAVDLKSFLPSDSFMQKYIRRPSHREKLTSLVSELKVFSDIFGENSLPYFDDSMWSTYFSIWSMEERCDFLNYLRLRQKGVQSANDIANGEKASRYTISVVSQQKRDNDEIVYAPGFNNFIELRGQDFRNRIYGSRILSLERCDELLPTLIVDCRFLTEYSVVIQSKFVRQIEALHDSNWTSRIPFKITIANFRPDNQLAEIVKRHLFFHYGPPSVTTSFTPHPFAPTLTSRDTMYISWRATKFLPEKPPANIRAAVLCASNDFQPWSSSISAAEKEGITTYRLPVERYIKFDVKKRVFSLREMSSILRSYFHGEDIGEAIRKAAEFLPTVTSSDNEEEDLLKALLSLSFIFHYDMYRDVIQLIDSKNAQKLRSVSENRQSPPLIKKNRTHRYTREQRREMRKQMEATSNS
ncbi:hypothetical protein DICVIV_05630 [Dictyocaulus viviparus]|uniref:tRNA (guanine(9)-N(1))-methyltransferase n=1 Tax=Dictyocaulus viviparus TaxID=29172 RepID=A0A0D8XUI9_DICVI|nr:hypothetical protein DICVIV_05630 [Dictyocaulus viviparus]